MDRVDRIVSLAVVAGMLLAARPARAAWDGTQQVVPGDRVTAVFAAAPGTEVHDYPFYAPDGTKLTVSWKVAHGQALSVAILDPEMQPVDTGSHLKGRTIRRLPLATHGRYVIEIRSTAGAGRYSLRTSASYPKRYGDKGVAAPASGDYTLDLGLPTGTRLGGKVKAAKHASGTPTFSGLTGPQGAVDLGAADAKSFKKVTVSGTGLYELGVAPGGAASLDLRVTARFPKGRTSFSFDATETTPGTADAVRLAWLGSAHADLTSEPFSHWNDESPAVIPKECAKCHSGLGYRDFLGVLANPYATPPEAAPTSNVNDPAPSPGQGQVASGPWPVGTPVDCNTCHNDATDALTAVTFPSGLTITGLGPESRCMVCHQGRESTVSVETKIGNAYAANKITSDDTVSPAVSFINIHYFAAAGSLYGREVKVAYEYPDPANSAPPDPVTGLTARKSYDAKFAHVASRDVCFKCHDQHSLKVRVTECATCHVDRNGDPIVTAPPANDAEYEAAIDRLHDVRMAGTINDFNGNGDVSEGVYYEMQGLADTLYAAIRAYAASPKTDATGAAVAPTPIAYSGARYPYFFVDANDNGTVDAGETTAYNAWTARLLRAAYDYQYSQKDPGAFAHNAKYLIELLYDAIADLNGVVPVANFASLVRNDSGHFDTSAEAYRHWDEDTDHLVDPSCARCHSPEGFLFRVKYGIDQTIPAQLTSGMTCESCHETGTSFSPVNGNKPVRRYVKSVTFPVPATATSSQIAAVTISQSVCAPSCSNAGTTCADDSTCTGCTGTAPFCVPPAEPDDSFVCMTCHQGRESTLTVNTADPLASPKSTFTISFRNVHYLSAGATQYGSKAAVAYQYQGKVYAGPWEHTGTLVNGRETKTCAFCHMQNGSHSFAPEVVTICTQCHGNATIDTLGPPDFAVQHDYDNDPSTRSKAEVAVFGARLLAAIQAYCAAAADGVSPPSGASYCAYNGNAYPYWYKDTNKNGVVDPAETTTMKFDSKSLRAAYNYQYFVKEPGAWAHNNAYIVQVLYDSIEDLGGDLTNLTRP
jgi:hypothetical protein